MITIEESLLQENACFAKDLFGIDNNNSETNNKAKNFECVIINNKEVSDPNLNKTFNQTDKIETENRNK